METNNPVPILTIPTGTHVVLRVDIPAAEGQAARQRGSVGVVQGVPSDESSDYRVQFPDGTEACVARDDLSIRRSAVRYDLENGQVYPLSHAEMETYIIYRCVVGSRAYGLDHAESDTDRRGIYLPPADVHWSLAHPPEQLENPETEECYWELQKFLLMALKANPNVLECLYSPLVEYVTPLAEELLAMRHIFLSQYIYQTYNGYVMSQFRKLEQDLRTKGQIKWKHAMHLIRLLLSGITVLQEGFVPVRVDRYRELLLYIRHGNMSWDEVNSWRLALHREFDTALSLTPLPERPDYAAANAFLIRARRSMVSDLQHERGAT